MRVSPLFRAVPPLALASAALLLAGCSSLQSSQGFLSRITPYRLEIVQGNVVTQEQAAQIKPGMNRAQVRDILGSPLLTDPFHADRWDYVFSIRRRGTEPVSYTHLRAHETPEHLVCRLLLEKKN